MAELKTKPNDQSVEEFIAAVKPVEKQEDCRTLLKLIGRITGEAPKMWGSSIIGYGSYHYRYNSGREGDWFLSGFSPRKQSLTIYMMGGYSDSNELLPKLGKHKKSVGCLYIKSLSDIDINILEKLIVKSIETLKKTYKEFN